MMLNQSLEIFFNIYTQGGQNMFGPFLSKCPVTYVCLAVMMMIINTLCSAHAVHFPGLLSTQRNTKCACPLGIRKSLTFTGFIIECFGRLPERETRNKSGLASQRRCLVQGSSVTGAKSLLWPRCDMKEDISTGSNRCSCSRPLPHPGFIDDVSECWFLMFVLQL